MENSVEKIHVDFRVQTVKQSTSRLWKNVNAFLDIIFSDRSCWETQHWDSLCSIYDDTVMDL